MTVIRTKYLGPTTHRGARVKATSFGGCVTVAWDYALDMESNHFVAAHELARKFELWGQYVHFDLPGGDGEGLWVRAEFQTESGDLCAYQRFPVLKAEK